MEVFLYICRNKTAQMNRKQSKTNVTQITYITQETRKELVRLAAEYETKGFLNGDPSSFMHQVQGKENQEVTAFVASCLSYGNRSQFLPKIRWIVNCAKGDVYGWVWSGLFTDVINAESDECFYRLYSFRQMNAFLCRLRQMLQEYGSMGQYVRKHSNGDAFSAVVAICRWFANSGTGHIVPKNTQSSCKRICLFLRWMVRSGSPVDLGIWADFISRRSLIMPLDTHVLQQSIRIGLLKSKTATMNTAKRLTNKLCEIFPDDPLKGDFALFGYGVNN